MIKVIAPFQKVLQEMDKEGDEMWDTLSIVFIYTCSSSQLGTLHNMLEAPERKIAYKPKVLRMKIVASLKTMINSMLRTEKIRACVCGNFQTQDPYMLIYTANIDITSNRLVLSEVSQDDTWGISTMDVKTAF